MKPTHLLPVIGAALAAVLLTACGADRTWDGKAALPEGKRIVLFAPADVGAVAEVHPAAPADYPEGLARIIDVMVEDARAFVGTNLPPSGDAAWERGPVGAARGAHMVVLTQVTKLKREPSPADGGTVSATVRMRALDLTAPKSTPWEKILSATASLKVSPKTMSDAAKPESKAAYEAAKKCLFALQTHLNGLPTPSRYDASKEPAGADAPLVDVVIDSLPPNADIIVDGVFRGTTSPTKIIPLPVRDITVRIERQNFQPWERKLTPASGMKIQPALEPLPGIAAPPPAPKPAAKPEPKDEPEAAPAPEAKPETDKAAG